MFSEQSFGLIPTPPYSEGRVQGDRRVSPIRDLFVRLLTTQLKGNPDTSARVGPHLCLFQIVSCEWVMALGVFNSLLCRFEDDSSLLVPSSENSWHISLAEFKRLLLENSDMIYGTLKQLRKLPPDGGSLHAELIEDFESHHCTIQVQIDRADKAIVSHTAFMAIHESRKAIMQAESVRRLSTMAFIFIPLSFTAAIFSMNVQELTNPPRSWVVVVTGVVVTIIAVIAVIHWDFVRRMLFVVWYVVLWLPAMAIRAIRWLYSSWQSKEGDAPFRRRDSGLGKRVVPSPPVVGLMAYLAEKGA